MQVGRIRVAILEDQQVFRESLESLFERSGLEVVCRGSDVEGFMAQVARAEPDVALIDLRLERAEGGEPGDGVRAVELLRELHPHVRCLVLSASREPEEMGRCFLAGAAGYLCKFNVGTAELLEGVRRVAQGEQVVPPEFLGAAPSPRPQPLARLTPREREVLGYVAAGADNLQIAASLDITERTVKAHITNLYRKLGVENRIQMAMLAAQYGVPRPPHL
jgi:DNA-binding NarL/FixJ family response regulator